MTRAARGALRGGDVLWLFESNDDLHFLIADVAGSGRSGAASWTKIAPAVELAFDTLVLSHEVAEGLRSFGETVNELADAAEMSLTLAAGRWSSAGVDWATWGYGVHVLPSSDGKPWPLPDVVDAFGIKLGWSSPAEFAAADNAFVTRSWPATSRLVLFTDGLLEEDHANVDATWRTVGQISSDAANGLQSSSYDVMAELLARGPQSDDDLAIAVAQRVR